MYSTSWAAEAGLARVTIYQVKFTPHGHSRAWFLAFVHLERAVIETEVIIIFGKDPKYQQNNKLE